MMMRTEDEWATIQMVERDICFLYHQLSEYSYIMGDLYWGTVYSLPYWEFLQIDDIDSERMRFIRDGCLVFILTMAFNALDGSGNFISGAVEDCKKSVASFRNVSDERTNKLISTVLLALDTVLRGDESDEELETLSSWVHREYVRGYFDRIANGYPNDE